MFWLLVFVIVAVIVGGFAIWGLIEGWGLDPVPPPPPPTPFVTSAVGTSAHTIHLTLQMGSGAWGQVDVERYRPADQSSFIFSTSLTELDDTDLVPDIPAGQPNGPGVYRYRARYNIPPSPPGPWSPVKEARTLPLVDALNKGELTV